MGTRRRGRLHNETQGEASYSKLRGKLRTERWEAKIGGITNLNVPDRGTLDARGESFTGLDRLKVKALTLTEAEQATNSTDGRVLASGSTNPERAVDTAHIKDGAITRPKIPANTISESELAPGSVAGGHIKGKLGKSVLDLDLGNIDGKLNIGTKSDGDLPFSRVKEVPNFAKQANLSKLEKRVKKLEQSKKK